MIQDAICFSVMGGTTKATFNMFNGTQYADSISTMEAAEGVDANAVVPELREISTFVATLRQKGFMRNVLNQLVSLLIE